MSENLTLSMDSDVIEFAGVFSQKINKPISRIVEDYFIELKEKSSDDLPQDLRELYGIFEGIDTPDKYELRRNYIITRNIKDFKKSIIPAKTPEELLLIINDK